jgi:carboxypeptidase family protein/TonB-dependent receptor-like protein
MRGVYKFAVLVFLLTGFSAGQLYGQGGATGAISGVVVDSSGASIADAEVQIMDSRTDTLARKLTAGSDGAFTVTLLPPGTYYVLVNKPGFSQSRADNIEVRVTETTRVSIALKPGEVSERVEISAQVTNVETTNATTGESIGTATVRELPLATQNYQQLLSLSSGTNSELNASAQLGRGNVRIVVNGQREDNNNYLIEGISSTDYNVSQSTNVPLPNPDVIQEFKIQTSLYDASQGRNGGGNVNAILRSGSKGLHGDAYEYFRNDVLNANEFFLNAARQRRPSVKQNIFGVSLGGPVVKENLGYFFVNYQGTRQRSALSPGTQINNPAFPILPADRSAANLAAVFSTPATAPTAANPGGCPAVPIAIDPVVLKLLNFKSNQFGGDANGFLLPSIPGTPGITVNPDTCAVGLNSGAFLINSPGKYTDDQFTTNYDREFRGGQDKVGARFFFSNAESYLPFGAGGLQASLGGTLASSISAADLNFPYDLPVSGRFFSVSETHLFSPALVNEFRFGYVRITYSLLNIPPVTAPDLGIDRPTNNITNSIYKFTQFGSAGFQLGPTPPANQFQTQNNYNFVDTVSWVKGAHIFRFGGEFTRVNLDKLFPQTFNGQLFFFNSPGAPSTATSASIGGLTDFQKVLEGAPDGSFGGGGVYNHRYRTNDFAVFAQDDWKIRPDLTLNLGLRVEDFGAFKDDACHIGNLDPSLAAAGKYPFIYGGCVKKLNLAGLVPTGSDSTYTNDYTTGWGPRIGFAYDVFGRHNTTVRGGYGIYYVREDVGTADQLSFQGPFLPIAASGGPPGCLSTFFSSDSTCFPGSSNPNALPTAGKLDPAFVPCLGAFQGFPGGNTAGAASYACGGTGPGVIPSQGLFGLVVPRKFVAPNTQQWNLTVQRSLGRNWVFEIGYVGTHAVHLRETRTFGAQLVTAANPLTLTAQNGTQYTITESTVANGPARSANPGINYYNGMQIFADDAYSHYHSLQTTLSRRWGAGYFQAAYTFSKSTDATSTGNTALNTAFNNESTLAASRGFSDFDRPHRFVVSYRYELPFFKDATGLVHAALGGWAVSGITIFQSGTPFSVLDGSAGTAYIGGGLQSPTSGAQLVSGGTIATGNTPGSIITRVNNGYLNRANFTFAPPADPAGCAFDPNACTTAFGNLGRNIYRGPFQQNWDFSLIKNFRITERQQLRFTTDFFNIWNHANFANPTFTDISNPAFGKIFSTVGTPRLIQFALRYAF